MKYEVSIAEGDARMNGVSARDGHVVLLIEENTPLPRIRAVETVKEECRPDAFVDDEVEVMQQKDLYRMWKVYGNVEDQKRSFEDDRKGVKRVSEDAAGAEKGVAV
jgi:hypothetical protein